VLVEEERKKSRKGGTKGGYAIIVDALSFALEG
jgi:hypothetical protein